MANVKLHYISNGCLPLQLVHLLAQMVLFVCIGILRVVLLSQVTVLDCLNRNATLIQEVSSRVRVVLDFLTFFVIKTHALGSHCSCVYI